MEGAVLLEPWFGYIYNDECFVIDVDMAYGLISAGSYPYSLLMSWYRG